MRTFFAALALLSVIGAAISAEPHITGIFLSLRFGTEDVTGVEISVVFGGNDHYVIVQCAEGAPGIPEIALAHIRGTDLSFQLSSATRSGCPTTEFRGTIGNEGITGTFSGSDWPGFLKRGRSYWQ